MLNCKETSELVSRSLDERLSWSQRMGVRLHLLMCAACRQFAVQMSFLRRAARGYPGAGGGRDEASR
jgi:predicted anti-sigma-YlaC factor YlaD